MGEQRAIKKKCEKWFQKDFFKLMNNAVLEKLWRMWKNIDISSL